MGTELRSNDRLVIAQPYVAHVIGWNGSYLGVAMLIDVSPRGFRADVVGLFAAGMRLYLEPQDPHSLGRRRYPFQVVWSNSGPAGELGGEFLREMTDAEVEALARG